jgi:biopolymer transport protein TolR
MVERGDNREMPGAEITTRLRAIHDQNRDATVLVNGDRDASYQKVMSAIDLIKEAGFQQVSLISRPQEAAR